MTRRERLENRIAHRQEWAKKREAQASAVLNNRPSYASDWAFITQPGHIPARARLIAAEDRAYQSLAVAAHHESKADNLSHVLDKTIFSDDSDAVEAIQARIESNEAKREQMKKVNAFYRKGNAEGLQALGFNLESLQAKLKDAYSWCQQPYPAYELSKIGQRISGDRKRLEQIKGRQQRTAEAEAATNGVTIRKSPQGEEA